MYCDALLTAFVSIRSDGCTETLTITPAVTIASVCQAVPIEPGHIHLRSIHSMYTRSHTYTNLHIHTLTIIKQTGPNLTEGNWGKLGEVLFRG